MPADVDALVVYNTQLSDDYNVVGLAAQEVAEHTQPGQFVMIKPTRTYDPLLRRPFSIFEIIRDANRRPTGISILNKKVGVGTRLVYDLAPGDRIGCLGPLGRPFRLVTPPTCAWMVAGGVGLAPFATLAEALVARGIQTTLFYGARLKAELFHVDVFERLGTHVVVTTEDGSAGERGLVSQALERAIADATSAQPIMIYACGPTGMMRIVALTAVSHGHRVQVSLESMMGCGLGGCYGCVVKIRGDRGDAHYVRSCLEGPVFDGRNVAWEEMPR